MKSVSLCCPVWGRYELSAVLFPHWKRTFEQARSLGADVTAVIIGNDDNLDIAAELGFATIEARNFLGSKYNDGHAWAVREGFDFSFQVNSDQVHDPRLLAAIAAAPGYKLVQTHWLTAVHKGGKRAITTYNPLWAMKAYPLSVLEHWSRPCDEEMMRFCDQGVHNGVMAANPELDVRMVWEEGDSRLGHSEGEDIYWIEVDPLETIQFESETQLTPWARWQLMALREGKWENPVPWSAIEAVHGEELVRAMTHFYRGRR